jgi:hypothetical protein
MKVGEILVRRKIEAAIVVAAEKEKKKVHDVVPTAGHEKKTSSKRKTSTDMENDKGIRIKERQLEAIKPHEKRLQIDPSTTKDENVDVLATLKIQLMGTYPPKAKEPQESKDQPKTAPIDPGLVETEARTECAQVYFSTTCDPGGHLKQTSEEDAASKRFWEHYERTGIFLLPLRQRTMLSVLWM